MCMHIYTDSTLGLDALWLGLKSMMIQGSFLTVCVVIRLSWFQFHDAPDEMMSLLARHRGGY